MKGRPNRRQAFQESGITMSRWKAAFLHLLISIGIVSAVAAYILWFWYPPALFVMAKAQELLVLIGGVDLVIGPFLTLIVFKAGKATLRSDLSVIALLQAAFLAFGLYSLYVTRPVFMVASGQVFDLVFANEISPASLEAGRQGPYGSLGLTRPVLVGAMLPDDPVVRTQILDSALSGGGDLQTMPAYFVPYSTVAERVRAHGQALKAGEGVSGAEAEALMAAARDYGRRPEEVRYLPLVSRRGMAVMLIEAATGAVIGPVAVDPS